MPTKDLRELLKAMGCEKGARRAPTRSGPPQVGSTILKAGDKERASGTLRSIQAVLAPEFGYRWLEGEAMSTYTARAVWDDGWWVVTAPDVPGAISQGRRLDQAAENIAEAISLMVDQDVSPDQVIVDWDVPGETGEFTHQASELREKAERSAAEAGEKAEIAVVELRGRKFSYHDIGAMTKMSYQRAQQIAEKGTKHSRKSGVTRNRRSKVGD